MSDKVLAPPTEQDKKYVKLSEFIIYLVGVFFYTNMTGMVGSYRSAYLVNVLRLNESQVSLFNTLINIIPFVLNFFITMYIDGRRPGKSGKFRPLALAVAIPCGVLLVLTFWAPPALSGSLLLVYVTTIAVLWAVATNFGDAMNKVALVMTPNLKERDNVISFRSICSAVGNSAPLVIILVIGLIWDDEGTQYIIGAALCAVVGTILMLVATKAIRERVTYSSEKKNPLIGIKDVLINKYAWVILISEFLKNFRQIATFMGVFLAAALLGSTSKYLWFGLPTGIGTAVGMLLINFLLKKFNSKVLYISSGIYSVIINSIAFAVGYLYFSKPNAGLQILFIVFLFLIGLQFGASNLLPTMFQADVLEDIELKTGKRLDATLPFVIGIFTMISGTIAQALAPIILYGKNSIIGYIQPTDAVPDPEQSIKTKILMLFFYTVFHGLMMFLAGVPFFFYKLTGKTKEDIHNAVIEKRRQFGKDED
ncbi:MAG TPA: MFS transporter [Candidatus Eubacterium faecigallinarum]|nr:MFS transporter [Candidatus Eubacterium faecigallinarum]